MYFEEVLLNEETHSFLNLIGQVPVLGLCHNTLNVD
jgi:hypothetical protein